MCVRYLFRRWRQRSVVRPRFPLLPAACLARAPRVASPPRPPVGSAPARRRRAGPGVPPPSPPSLALIGGSAGPDAWERAFRQICGRRRVVGGDSDFNGVDQGRERGSQRSLRSWLRSSCRAVPEEPSDRGSYMDFGRFLITS